MNSTSALDGIHREVLIPIDRGALEGELIVSENATGIVLFAHGSGSSRFSPRNQFVAKKIRGFGIGTLLFDLLTRPEEARDSVSGELRFDIEFLAERLTSATTWLRREAGVSSHRLGYFGSSTGAAAALVAAAALPREISAIVSRGGRPDLAGAVLGLVKAPTLLIVGERDGMVVTWNQEAYARLTCTKKIQIVPRATHLFEEEGALDQVAVWAGEWLKKHLA